MKSAIRIVLMVVGLLALLPMTVAFGLPGCLVTLVFVLLAAFAS